MKTQKYKILLGLFLLSLASSLILSLTPVSEICDPAKGCDVVYHSQYNSTFGIKNSYFGVVFFLFLSLFTFSYIKKPDKNKKLLIHSAVILSSVIALYFLYIQQFILNSYCKYCLIVDFSMIAALVLVIIYWKK